MSKIGKNRVQHNKVFSNELRSSQNSLISNIINAIICKLGLELGSLFWVLRVILSDVTCFYQ